MIDVRRGTESDEVRQSQATLINYKEDNSDVRNYEIIDRCTGALGATGG